MRARTLLALLLALALTMVGPGADADARNFTSKKAIWGPVSRDGQSQFPIYHDLGAGIWQYPLYWRTVAPTQPADPTDPSDPAYQWPAELDQAVAEASRYRIRVMVSLLTAPAWANGGREYNWVPTDPGQLADFMTAMSRRYPTIRLWMIWGEPTRQPNFMPLTPETPGTVKLTPDQAAAPRYYARMLDAAYGALKGVSRSNLVIGGNTFTAGDISPLNWIRYLRMPNGRPPRMDLFGHNPFTPRRPGRRAPPPTGVEVNYSDFSDLDRFIRILDGNVRDPRGRPLKIFISEFFFPTDHANREFMFYLDLATQAAWLDRALRITSSWSRIYTLGWYSLYDDAPAPDGLEVNRGLMTYDGQRKPSYYVYRRR
jgi:hypothetical protein